MAESKLSLAEKFRPRLMKAEEELVSSVVKDTDPFTPYRTGKLAHSVTVEKGSESSQIRYTADYAHECYYAEHPFGRRFHPHATARWFEAAKSVALPSWRKKIADIIKGK